MQVINDIITEVLRAEYLTPESRRGLGSIIDLIKPAILDAYRAGDRNGYNGGQITPEQYFNNNVKKGK